MFLTVFITSAVIGLITYLSLRPFLQERVVRLNYRNRPLAGASGLIIIVTMLLVISLLRLQAVIRGGAVISDDVATFQPLFLFIFMVFAVGMLGFVDDLLGDRKESGLRGHFRSLREGRLTSGALKAIGGGATALIVASFQSHIILIVLLDTAVLTLAINSFNLLDLRPGRAIKVFLASGLILFIATFTSPAWSAWALVLPPILILLWGDLTERTMIGDTGSNIIGAIWGYTAIVGLNWYANLGILILLAGFHYYTEHRSLTELIMRVKILRSLDELGMRRR